MSDIDNLLNGARRVNSPAIKFQELGDGFQGTIVNRAIIDGKGFNPGDASRKNLAIELELDTPRTQVVKRKNAATGYYEAQEVTAARWTWWVSEGSRALTTLSDAIRDANAGPGAPNLGDRLKVKFVGLAPSTRTPEPIKLVEVTYKVGEQATPAPLSSGPLGLIGQGDDEEPF